MDDVRAVIDAAGSRLPHAVGFGRRRRRPVRDVRRHVSRTGTRTRSCGPGSASGRRAPDYPWAGTDHALRETELHHRVGMGRRRRHEAGADRSRAHDFVDDGAVGGAGPSGMPPSVATRLSIGCGTTGFPIVLPAIRVPTLVQSRNNPRRKRRWVTGQIPGASWRSSMIPGASAGDVGDTAAVLASVGRFVSGLRSDEVGVRSRTGDRAVHRHRRLDRAERRARRPRVAGLPRAARPRRALEPDRTAGRRSRRWATGSSPPSTARPEGSVARAASSATWSRWASRSAPGSTPARSRIDADDVAGIGGRDRRPGRRPGRRRREVLVSQHGEGSRRGVGPPVRGCRRARAEGRARPLAALPRGRSSSASITNA